MTNYDDVVAFHRKFNVPVADAPKLLGKDALDFRIRFMHEELTEFVESADEDDLAGMADALIDLVYVAMGTAAWMGLPWQEMWDEVQRANMSKVSAADLAEQTGVSLTTLGARNSYDVRKPNGWTAPDIEGALRRASLRTKPSWDEEYDR